MSARATASICRCPPDSWPGAEAAAAREVGEHRVHGADALGARWSRAGCRPQAAGSRRWSAWRRCSRSAARRRGRARSSRARATAVMSAPPRATRAAEDRHDPGDGLDEGRLAGTIRPQHHDQFARAAPRSRCRARSAGRAHSRRRGRCVARAASGAHAGHAEIGLDHRRVARHLGRRALGQQAARRHDDDAAAQPASPCPCCAR